MNETGTLPKRAPAPPLTWAGGVPALRAAAGRAAGRPLRPTAARCVGLRDRGWCALWRERTGDHASSAGTRPATRVHPGATAAAKRAGLDLARAHPRALEAGDLDADIVVTVCDRAHEELDAPDHWLHWSIPDPVEAGTRRAFDAALNELDERIAAVARPLVHPKESRP